MMVGADKNDNNKKEQEKRNTKKRGRTGENN
jgi:hypothetical protein